MQCSCRCVQIACPKHAGHREGCTAVYEGIARWLDHRLMGDVRTGSLFFTRGYA